MKWLQWPLIIRTLAKGRDPDQEPCPPGAPWLAVGMDLDCCWDLHWGTGLVLFLSVSSVNRLQGPWAVFWQMGLKVEKGSLFFVFWLLKIGTNFEISDSYLFTDKDTQLVAGYYRNISNEIWLDQSVKLTLWQFIPRTDECSIQYLEVSFKILIDLH